MTANANDTTSGVDGATHAVPVLPTSGVVLPELVVTIRVETDEAS